MDSSTLLVQAASGLEKYMAGSKPGVLKDSTVAQISAFVYYQSQVLSKLTTHKGFIQKFHDTIFEQIDKDFGNYIDAQARSKHRSLHHVYEWNRTGDPSARLFKLKMIPSNELSFKIGYQFIPSKTFASGSGNRKHVFKNKAAVMEAGMPLKIAPRFAERLVFESNGYTVFMPKGVSVTVKRPGGPGVKNQFMLHHSLFFRGQLVNQAIKKSGFQNLFNKSISRALSLHSDIKKVKYKFSPNTIKMQADSSLAIAFGGI